MSLVPFNPTRNANGRRISKVSASVTVPGVNSKMRNGGMKTALNITAANRPRRRRRRNPNRDLPPGLKVRSRRPYRIRRRNRSTTAKAAALKQLVVDEVQLQKARAQYAASIRNPFAIDPPCGGGFDGPSECITGTASSITAASGNTCHLYQCSASIKAGWTLYQSNSTATALSAAGPTPVDCFQQSSYAPTSASGFREFRPLVAGLTISIEDTSGAVYPTVVVGLMPQDSNFTSNTFISLFNMPYARVIPNARTATVVWVPTDALVDIFTAAPLSTGLPSGYAVPYIMLLGVSASCVVSVSYIVHGDAIRGTTSGGTSSQVPVSNNPSANYSFTDLVRGFAPIAEAMVTGAYNFFRDNPEAATAAANLFTNRMGQRRLIRNVDHEDSRIYPLSKQRGFTRLGPDEVTAYIDDASFRDSFDADTYYGMIQEFGAQSKSIEARIFHLERLINKVVLEEHEDDFDEKRPTTPKPNQLLSRSTIDLAESLISRVAKSSHFSSASKTGPTSSQ
jgi:hypothetical protein